MYVLQFFQENPVGMCGLTLTLSKKCLHSRYLGEPGLASVPQPSWGHIIESLIAGLLSSFDLTSQRHPFWEYPSESGSCLSPSPLTPQGRRAGGRKLRKKLGFLELPEVKGHTAAQLRARPGFPSHKLGGRGQPRKRPAWPVL